MFPYEHRIFFFTTVFLSIFSSVSPHREVDCKNEPPDDNNDADLYNGQYTTSEEHHIEEKPFVGAASQSFIENGLPEASTCSQENYTSPLMKLNE